MNNYLNIQREISNKLTICNYLTGIAFIVLFLFFDFNIYSTIGIILFSYLSLRLFIMMDYNIPVIEIMLFIAASQWIIGPIIDFQNEIRHFKMYMYVSEYEYMKITIPLFFAFMVSSISFFKHHVLNLEKFKQYVDTNIYLPFFIISFGLIAKFSTPLLPPSLYFIAFLIHTSIITGIGILFFSSLSLKIKIFTTLISFIPILNDALNSGMFHIVILVGLFIFIYINLTLKLSLFRKIILIISAIFLLSSIQLIKGNYRNIIYDKAYSGNKTDLFFGMLFNQDNIVELNDSEEQNNINIRLNQGWIISKIYERIPSKKNFLGGETVNEAIKSALLPRFLAPNKKGGGGKDTYEKLTGFKLLSGTAMGASLMGEFYANYGVMGGMIAFVIWGALLQIIVSKLYDTQEAIPFLIFFLPIIFFQVIKAETDLTTVLNHLVKSIFFVVMFSFLIRNVMNLKKVDI